MNRARRSVRFERKPSQRYSRRPNFEPLSSVTLPRRDKDNNDTAIDNKYLFDVYFYRKAFVKQSHNMLP